MTREGLAQAIEQCNGAGVCRKSGGVMCPSFQATQDEMHSTRGRANLLRAMISGQLPDPQQSGKLLKTALDLCLACKGCKSECPSGVDIAKLKYEFLELFYSQPGNRHPWRDYLFGYIHFFGKLGYPFRVIINLAFKNRLFINSADRFLGLSSNRRLPVYASQALRRAWNRQEPAGRYVEKVIFLSDSFTEYFHVEAGLAALKLLQNSGCQVVILPVLGAGRTLISKGFLSAAKRHAGKVVEAIRQLDPSGICPVVSIEPSEIYTLRDEYVDLFPEDRSVLEISQRAWMVDEYLLRPDSTGLPRIQKIKAMNVYEGRKVFLHSHCYQKAQPPATDGFPTGSTATIKLLQAFSIPVELIDAGCCGMAGAFGYEKEHYALSQKVGELALYPAIREARAMDANTVIAVNGVSCHTQVEDGTGCLPVHPVQLVAKLL
jgi:Fe-S oxidoreductase